MTVPRNPLRLVASNPTLGKPPAEQPHNPEHNHRNPLNLNDTHRTHTTTPHNPPPPTTSTNITTNNWRTHAACKGQTNLMFPKDHKDITYIKPARALCKTCPARQHCLEDALQYPTADMSGVWAGLTPRQLAAEQRRRGITPTKPSIAILWKELSK